MGVGITYNIRRTSTYRPIIYSFQYNYQSIQLYQQFKIETLCIAIILPYLQNFK